MRSLRAWFLRFAGLFARQRCDRDLADEMESHLQMHIEDNLQRGMTPAEARRQALIKLGGVEQTKEEYRDRRGIPFLESLLQDIRFALRMLRKSPGFTAVAVLTLALGIGANTAIFSVLEAQLWKSLPFPQSERLVAVMRTDAKHPDRVNLFTEQDFPDLLASAKGSFADVCAFQGYDYHTTPGTDTADMVTVRPISSSFFETLRMPPALGRAFLPSEQQDGRDREVILSHEFWQQHYASDPKIIGQTIVLDGSPSTIVGVAPAALHLEIVGNPDMYVPLVLTRKSDSTRTGTGIFVVARLKPGMPLSLAQAQMDVIAKQLASEYPQRDANHGLKLQDLRDAFSPQHQGLFFFATAAGLVLLIA
ncbi:MAG: ABC transporter permease, partial [Candidatus Acidiferrales bacterium]